MYRNGFIAILMTFFGHMCPAFAIHGGERLKPQDPISLAVGCLTIETESAFLQCTATLISSNLVLTAAHCLQAQTSGPIDPKLTAKVDPQNPKMFYVRFGNFDGDTPLQQGTWAPAIDFRSYPGFHYASEKEPYKSFPFNDVAIIKIDSSYLTPGKFEKVKVLNSLDPLSAGSRVRLAGYGPNGDQSDPYYTLRGIWVTLSAPYDSKSSFILINWPPPKPKYIGLSHGDSGGPAFIEENGQPILAATDAGGATYEPVPVYLSWLREMAHEMGGDADF